MLTTLPTREALKAFAEAVAGDPPLVNENGSPLYTALVGRGADGRLVVVVPLDPDSEEGAWLIASWSDREARDLLLALEAHHEGGGHRMIARLDKWAAEQVFWPIIIKICQELGCTQWAFGRACMLAFAMFQVVFLFASAPLLLLIALPWLVSRLVMCAPGLRNLPYCAPGFERAIWAILFLQALVAALVTHRIFVVVIALAPLFHCYASILPRVPPRDPPRRRAYARSGG